MAQSQPPESILFADCGAVATKAGLVDRIDGEYRLVGVGRAQTTVEPPIADIIVGVQGAIGELETLTGRQLLSDEGTLISPEAATGAGVDAFAATTSAALPLRVVVMGLSRDFSVASAHRALTSAYVVLEQTIAADEESGRWGANGADGRASGSSEAIDDLSVSHPDLVLMVGGSDGGAVGPLLEMANIIASISAAMDEDARPLVLFAGNREARAQVAERLGSLVEFRAVDNVRPGLDSENLPPLEVELERIFYERQVKRIPGLDTLSGWCDKPVLTTASAYELVARYVAKRYGLRVLAVDLGGASTVLIRADPTQAKRALSADFGVAYGLDRLIDRVGLDRIARWLPKSIMLDRAHAQVLNQALRPWTTPILEEERQALNAAAREVLALAAGLPQDGEASATDLVLLSGAPLVRGGKLNSLMAIALDALDLGGTFSVAADLTGLAPALGALAAVSPGAAAQVLERDAFVTLGTAVVPTITARLGDSPAVQARIETALGGCLDVQVASGSLELIPLGLGEKARVELHLAGAVNLDSSGKGGVVMREMEGGMVGLVIDARGRPLPVGDDLDHQRERAQRWLWDLGA
jgi:MutL protein